MDIAGTYYRDGLLYCTRCRTPIRHVVEFPYGMIRVVGCLCACQDEKFNREREAEKLQRKCGYGFAARSSGIANKERGRSRKKVQMGYSHITWACPYFSYDSKRVVKCEAGRINFPDREAEKEHVHKYCADPKNWRQCSLAAYMNGYYARQEEEELEERKKQLIRQGGE